MNRRHALVLTITAGLSMAAGPCFPLQTQRIIPPDASQSAKFGSSIAIDGEYAVIGARGAMPQGGRAYLYRATENGLQFASFIDPTSNNTTSEQLGVSCDMQGDTIVVGNVANSADGEAWVMRIVDGVATDPVELGSLSTVDDAEFGRAVSIDGDWIVVGDDDVVHIYQRIGGQWFFREMLEAPFGDPAPTNINFGSSVLIDGSRLYVGALNEGSAGGGLNGAVYVFDRVADSWSFSFRLLPFEGTAFGSRIAVNDDYLAVTSVTGPLAIYARPVGQFSIPQILGSVEAESVEFARDVLLAGDLDLDHPDGSDRAGGVRVLEEIGGTWQQTGEIFQSDGVPFARFGEQIAVDGSRAIFGAIDDRFGQTTSGGAYEVQLRCGEGCLADLEAPFGTLDLADIAAFVTAFSNGAASADLAPPGGVLDLADISAFVTAFVQGCP